MDKRQKILITGGNGFLGKTLCNRLKEKGYNNITTFRSEEYDLRKEEEVKRMFREHGPFAIVLHLAASVGGIGFFKSNPGKTYYENTMINTLVQEYARLSGALKFLGLGSVLAYPADTPVPFKEGDLWNGYPDKSTYAYGLSKRLMHAQSISYREQYGFNAIHLILTNVYGPGYDFSQSSPHVIPSLLKKFEDAQKAGEGQVVLWGTGKATREFLFIDDAIEAIILAMESYNSSEPINIGSGEEVSIKELSEKIASLAGFKGEIAWDSSKPEGKLRSLTDSSKAYKNLGFKAKTLLDEGLKKTIEWYRKSLLNADTF